jgi:hypothetical protein
LPEGLLYRGPSRCFSLHHPYPPSIILTQSSSYCK